MKKEWETPELIILVRSNPEESVLVVCKRGGVEGPNTLRNNCDNPSAPELCERNQGS
jgi:hypothetical protein